MKILAIRIKNLASLEGETEINFTQEPLKSAGIYAITGATGAGKSTILDALCLAIYARTPRYQQGKESGIEIKDVQGSSISQGDVRGILRDGTADGFAEVDFVSVDGQNQRAAWRVRRARNKAEGALQSDTVELTNIDSNVIYAGRKIETLKEIERLVGLNFEQFTRSVLLAQGDFTAFLKAEKDEKASLLEKLTGTFIFSEISKRVFENTKQAEQVVRDLHKHIENVEILSVEQIEDLNLHKEALNIELAKLDGEIIELEKEIIWHTTLSKMESEKSISEEAWKKALEEEQKAEERKQILKQIETVQVLRTHVDARKKSVESNSNKHLEFNNLKKLFQNQLQAKEKLKIDLNAVEKSLNEKKNEYELSKPILENAKILDSLLVEKSKQVNNAQKEYSDQKSGLNKEIKNLENKQNELFTLSNEIAALTKWKEANQNNQAVAENFELIKSRLENGQKALKGLNQMQEEMQQNAKDQNVAINNKTDFEAQKSVLALDLQSIESEISADNELLASIPFHALETEKALTDTKTVQTKEALTHWQSLLNADIELAELQRIIQSNQLELSQKTQQLTESIKKVSDSKIIKEASARSLEIARLQTAENVEALRAQLIEGDACPVCGSTHHPFADQNPKLNKLLHALEAEHRRNEDVYELSLRENSTLTETCERLQSTIEKGNTANEVKSKIQKGLKLQWDEFIYKLEIEAVEYENQALYLQQKLDAYRNILSELQKEIVRYKTIKERLDENKIRFEKLEKALNSVVNNLKDIERILTSCAEKFDRLNKQSMNLEAELSETEAFLSAYFRNPDWAENWRRSHSIFVSQLAEFARLWNTKIKKLEESQYNSKSLSVEIEHIKNHVDSIEIEVSKKEEKLTELSKEANELTDKRRAIFDGEDIELVESRMKQDIVFSEERKSKRSSEFQELTKAITISETQQLQLINDLAVLEKSIVLENNSINEWLSEYNQKNISPLNEDMVLSLLSYSFSWREAESNALKVLENKVLNANSLHIDKERQLTNHIDNRISEKTTDEVNVLFAFSKDSRDETLKRKNEIDFRVKQDSENKSRIGVLLKEIEAKTLIAENWGKLNTIIGSSDGKKFRHIAQEYTLDVLLSFANIHLNMLTKRYLVERIPHTLGLVVLDKDMGDEIRTVFSLSGGESFLVSLALALGLASLSSDRMKVESLFIDEGFGALDPTTLNIAMDALERLHNQGRKVGVISHVQEMTERIPVQIKVSKLSNGKSKVEII
jgi:DNA repair protein SbcC/Rad50